MVNIYNIGSGYCCGECEEHGGVKLRDVQCTCGDGWDRRCEFHGEWVEGFTFVPAERNANPYVLTHRWNGVFKR